MQVLIVTNMFPDAARPYNGIFIAEQMDAISRYHPDVHFDVCYIEGENKGKAEYLKSVFKVNRLIRRGHYDLVHIHFGPSGLYLLSPFSKRVPTIVTFHGSDIQPAGGNGPLTISLSRRVAHLADACITLNAQMDAMVRRHNPNTYIVPCGVCTQLFKPATRPHHEGLAAQGGRVRRIIFPCSRDMAVKNYPLFCQTLHLLRDTYGIRCEEQELAGLSRQQVAALFNDADLLLMTSHSEGSPQAVKEAMACDLPVVSPPVGDVPELLHHVRNSYVSHTHDADELAALAMKALSQASREGMAGSEKIRQMRLDEHSVADRIYTIYEKSKHTGH